MTLLAAEDAYSIANPTGTGLGPFPTQFTCREAADVVVAVRVSGSDDLLLVLGVDYTVSGATPEMSGLDVNLTQLPADYEAWPDGAQLIIFRATDAAQLYELSPELNIKPQQLKRALDRITRITQEHNRDIGRATKAVYGETGPELPTEAARAGKLAVWSDDGKAMRTDRSLTAFDAAVAATVAAKNLTLQYKQETEEILQDCQTVGNDVTTKHDTVVAKAGQVAADKVDIDAGLAAIETLLGDVEVATLAEVVAAVGANATQVSDDKDTVTALKGDVEGLKDDVVAVQADINTNIGDLGGLTVGEAVAQVAADRIDVDAKATQVAADKDAAAASATVVSGFANAMTPNALSKYLSETLKWGIAFTLRSLVQVGKRVAVGGFSKVDGFFESWGLRIRNSGARNQRWKDILKNGDGNALMAWDESGRGRFIPDAYTVSLTSAQVADADLPQIAGIKALFGLYGSQFDTFWSNAWGEAMAIYRRSVTTGSITVCAAERYDLVLVTGQSNSTGSSAPYDESANLLPTLRYAEGALTFNTNYPWHGPSANTLTAGSATDFRQTIETQVGDLGDTGIANSIAMYDLLRGRAGLSPIPIVGSACGIAGQAWSVVKKGGTGVAWANSLIMAADAVTIATVKGSGIRMRYFRIVHGEADADLNPAAGTYKGYMVTMLADLNTDFPPITGQSESVRLNIAQLATRADGVTAAASSQISHDQHLAAIENDGIILGGIGYICETFGIHYTSRGRRYFMEQMAKAEFRSEQLGRDVCHLYIKSAVYSTSGGYKVLCTVGGDRVGKMRRRNTSTNAGWLNPHPTAGLTISSSSGAATITGISFPADDQILITLSGALGTSPMLYVGYNNGGGNAEYSGSPLKGYPYDYTDICDDDATPSLEYPERGLPNFLAVHKVAIT